jgi:hypothetical protein
VEEYLYDLLADPYELTNLVSHESHLKVREHLRTRLIARMVSVGEEAPVIHSSPEPAKPRGQRHVTDEEVLQ